LARKPEKKGPKICKISMRFRGQKKKKRNQRNYE
jgi:hypothetical protein